jgi:hypothetical protein
MSQMRYGITKEAIGFTPGDSSGWRYGVFRVVSFIIPRANPDHERLYRHVCSWALELDDLGWPQREVGLDAAGKPLFRAPNERNTGFWPDMASKQFDVSELQCISAEKFRNLWDAAQADA